MAAGGGLNRARTEEGEEGEEEEKGRGGIVSPFGRSTRAAGRREEAGFALFSLHLAPAGTHVAHGYESGNLFCLKSRSFFLAVLVVAAVPLPH